MTMDSVLFRVERGVGEVRLNRPDALNALNLEMVSAILRVLTAWLNDDTVATVVISGEGSRAFCAGGDLLSTDEADEFLRTEYRVNALIAEYPKPVISFMHGVVLGGGVGLGAHAALRVVTEDTRIGMPETRIGLTPDVGGSWLLARAPHHIGMHLALTSGTMSGAEAIECGFADYFIPVKALSAVLESLRDRAGAEPERTLLEHSAEYSLPETPTWVARSYAEPDLSSVLKALDSAGDDAGRAAARIREMCPTAVAVTFHTLRRVEEEAGLRGALQRELELISALSKRGDVREGIRARLVDRDTPRWVPETLDDVDIDEVELILATRAEPLFFTNTHRPAYQVAAPTLR
ncbi:MAG: enoyl-CoA hydratase/isomerase family protein [Rhodoglobus sp.]